MTVVEAMLRMNGLWSRSATFVEPVKATVTVTGEFGTLPSWREARDCAKTGLTTGCPSGSNRSEAISGEGLA
jgi:predicted Rossmann-fold nucleotide-binding protein